MVETTSIEIENIFNENKVNDLKRFMVKRQQLNNCNIKLRYLHYIMHYSSILVTTVAVSYNNNTDIHLVNMIWIGISLNIVSSLISSFEKMNKSMSTKLLNDIYKIKTDTYIDETELVDSFHENSSNSSTNNNNNQKVNPA
jgi:hypothetical protein